MIKGIVIGFILAVAISVGCVFVYFSAGMAPVATAVRRSERVATAEIRVGFRANRVVVPLSWVTHSACVIRSLKVPMA